MGKEQWYVHGKGIRSSKVRLFYRPWWKFWVRKGVYVETEPGSGKFEKWEAPKAQSKSNNKEKV